MKRQIAKQNSLQIKYFIKEGLSRNSASVMLHTSPFVIQLKKGGFTNCDGADFSQKMLDLVPENIYENLFKSLQINGRNGFWSAH